MLFIPPGIPFMDPVPEAEAQQPNVNLSWTNLSITSSGGGTFSPGDTAHIEATLAWEGDPPMYTFSAKGEIFYPDDCMWGNFDCGGTLKEDFLWSGISINSGTVTLTADKNLHANSNTVAGDYTLRLTADTGNAFDETNESDNVITGTFTVTINQTTVLPPLTTDVQMLGNNDSPITDLSNIPQDEDILFLVDVTNNQSFGQLYAMYLQIRDADGALAEEVERYDDYLQAGEERTEVEFGDYWVDPGSYTATLFFLDEVNLTPLADPVTIAFTKTGNTNLFDEDFPPTTSHSDELGTVVQDGPITVGVEKASYNISEIVTISGTIENYNGVDSVLLSISDSYNIKSVHQISPNASGAFSVNEVLNTRAFNDSGTYTVKVQSGSDSAETSFVFNHSIFPEPAVATYLDNNQIETLDQLPTVNNYRQYVVALHWQEDLKPLLLGLNNVHMMFSLLHNSIGDRCGAAWDTHDQTTRYNSDGTERDEYLLTRENAYLLCELNNDYLSDIRNYMSQGMSLQAAINQVDPRAQNEISYYEDQFEELESQPFGVPGVCDYGAVLIDEVCEPVSTPYFMANPRIVDAFGNTITNVVVNQQIQIAADIANVQSTDQQFAYITVVRDADGAVVNNGLSWITGAIQGGHSLSPALSWEPHWGGSYTATVFLIDSIDNPIPLSDPVTTSFNMAGGMECTYCITPPTDVSDNSVTAGESSADGPISIAAEKVSYSTGEIIEISGTIENYDGVSSVVIMIWANSYHLLTLNQVTPDASGAFSVDEPTVGHIFGPGTFTVKAQSGSDSAETTFNFVEIDQLESGPAAEAVATFLANNPIEAITELPEMEHYWSYAGYKAALYYQENMKPFFLQNESLVPTLLEVLAHEFSERCESSWDSQYQHSVFNSDGTENEQYKIAELNSNFNCELTHYPEQIRWFVENGMSLQSAINDLGEEAEQRIDEYFWNLNIQEPEIVCEPGSHLENGDCVLNQVGVIYNAQGSSTPGCEEINLCFIPSTLTVDVGSSVTWVNSDSAAHTATSGSPTDGPTGIWDSTLIMPGSSFSRTFNTSGIFDYFCMVHPWMTGIIGVGTLIEETEVELPVLNVSVTKSEYNLDEQISLIINLDNTESSATVIVDVLDPAGNPVVTRSTSVSPNNSESIQFRISNNFLTGNYKVVASATIDGNMISDTTYFKIKSLYNQFQITSVQVTDQQGNPSTLTKGTLGYVKVTVTSDANITTLITVNLFDAELTTLGVGSVRSTLSEGESEIILSFLIPSNAASGDAEIFANGFTDWISNGGVPLTGEFSTIEEII